MKLKRNDTIEVCDLCRRECLLRTCIFCGCRYCLRCDGIIPGSMIQPRICGECENNKTILALCGQYSEKLHALAAKRDAAIKKAGTHAKH